VPFENVPAEESARQSQKCFVDVCSFLVANTQAPELVQPGERLFHDPTPSAQSASLFGVGLRKKRDDVAGNQTLPDCR